MNSRIAILILLFCGLCFSQGVEGPGISVKDKKAIESEVAKLTAKLTELQGYWAKYVHHRDNIREGFLHDSIFKLKGLAQDQIDSAFEKFDDFQDYLDRLKESIFAADPENREKWTKVLGEAGSLYRIYPELEALKEQALAANQQQGVEKVLAERKKHLLEQLERVQALAKDLSNLKKVNEQRIQRYRNMHQQLKEWSQATPDTWEGPFNQPMPKSKLLWVIVETKKEIVTLKRSILNLIKFVNDEELRGEILRLKEVKHVF